MVLNNLDLGRVMSDEDEKIYPNKEGKRKGQKLSNNMNTAIHLYASVRSLRC